MNDHIAKDTKIILNSLECVDCYSYVKGNIDVRRMANF